MFDVSSKGLERVGESNKILVDKKGVPSFMVRIPKVKMCDLVKGGSENVHPAFIVGGNEVDEIYVSKYLNTIIDDNAASIPLEYPELVDYDTAKELCERKGDGWHLMTNAEYSLLALLSLSNNTLPNGNNNYGTSTVTGGRGQGGEITLGGTGDITWSNTHDITGIFDLNGNVNEWVAGLRTDDGIVQVLIDNNASRTGANTGSQSTLWKTINTDGTYGEIGEEDVIRYTEDQDKNFKELADINTKEILIGLGLGLKDSTGVGEDFLRVNILGERLARRGGSYNDGDRSGVFSLDLTATRDSGDTGFRCCYIKP